jgi:hypothetical protein
MNDWVVIEISAVKKEISETLRGRREEVEFM